MRRTTAISASMLAPPAAKAVRDRVLPSALTGPAAGDTGGRSWLTHADASLTACAKEIPLDVISQLNKDLRTAMRHGH